MTKVFVQTEPKWLRGYAKLGVTAGCQHGNCGKPAHWKDPAKPRVKLCGRHALFPVLRAVAEEKIDVGPEISHFVKVLSSELRREREIRLEF